MVRVRAAGRSSRRTSERAKKHPFLRRAEAPGPGLRRAERLYTALWAREKGGKTQRLSRALGGQAEALRGDRATCLVHLLDTS